MADKQYHIHNTTKSVQTKFVRAQAPGNPKTSLLLAGGTLRVLRNRPLTVSEPLLRKLLAELRDLEDAGRCRVTTVRGVHIDLKTLLPASVSKKAKEDDKDDEEVPMDSDKTEKQEVPEVPEVPGEAPDPEDVAPTEETPEVSEEQESSVPPAEETPAETPVEPAEPEVVPEPPEELPAERPTVSENKAPSRKKRRKNK